MQHSLQRSAAGASSSHSQNSPSFPQAIIFDRYERREGESQHVWLAITSCLRWKEFKNVSEGPQNLLDFDDGSRLKLRRFPSHITWADIKQVVQHYSTSSGYGLFLSTDVVRGAIERVETTVGDESVEQVGSACHLKSRTWGRYLGVVVVARDEAQRDGWMNEFFAQIVPWQLMNQHVWELVESPSVYVSPNNLLKLMFKKVAGAEHMHDASHPAEFLSKSDEVAKLFSIVPTFIERLGSVAKEIAPGFPNTANVLADATKCVSLVNLPFQIAATCARLYEMDSEARRGRVELPQLYEEVANMLFYVSDKMMDILNPEIQVDDVSTENIFRVQEECYSSMGDAELQLMRGPIAEDWHSEQIKKIESSVRRIRQNVVSVSHTCQIPRDTRDKDDIHAAVEGNKLRLNEIEPTPVIDNLPLRPSLSPYFVGRSKEYDELLRIVKAHGSAAIMQYGGVGKTQLMVSFAERAEREGLVRAESSFWIMADGNGAQVVSSFADFVERLVGRKLNGKDRESARVVLSVLKSSLESIEGRWLLCIDNADHPDVGGVIGQLCNSEYLRSANGWVLVTSRQGVSRMWRGMKMDQKLQLEPLVEDDAMAVLWRWKKSETNEEQQDNEIISQLKQLKQEDLREYCALRELAGSTKICGLGGLPLALDQAGSYICRTEISFAGYVKLYEEVCTRTKIFEVFDMIDECECVREEQRAVWTTWKVNVDSLQDCALQVLRAITVLETAPIPKIMMEKLVERCCARETSVELRYNNIVRGTLMNGASLLQMDRNAVVEVFSLHRLVRQFLIMDAKRKPGVWESAVGLALEAVHTCAESVLENAGYCFGRLPKIFNEQLRVIVPHSVAVVRSKLQLSKSTESGSQKEQIDLHRLSAGELTILGKPNEAWQLCERLLKLYRVVHGHQIDHPNIANTLRGLARLATKQGALKDAEKLYTESLQINRRVYGEKVDDPNIATMLQELASVTLERGALEDAEMLYMESLQMQRRMYGDEVDHPNVAAALYGLANVAIKQGALKDAEKLYMESLQMQRQVYGDKIDHPDIADTLYKLASVALERGTLKDAEKLYTESLQMKRRVHGNEVDHPNIATALYGLARLATRQGALKDAEKLYTESLQMCRRVYGNKVDHPDIAITLQELASVTLEQGILKGAEKLYMESLRMQRRMYGNEVDHPNIARTLYGLGNVLEARCILKDARKLYRECLRMRSRLYKQADHPEVLATHEKLKGLLAVLGSEANADSD